MHRPQPAAQSCAAVSTMRRPAPPRVPSVDYVVDQPPPPQPLHGPQQQQQEREENAAAIAAANAALAQIQLQAFRDGVLPSLLQSPFTWPYLPPLPPHLLAQFDELRGLQHAYDQGMLPNMFAIHQRLMEGHYASSWACLRDIRGMFAMGYSLCGHTPAVKETMLQAEFLLDSLLPSLPTTLAVVGDAAAAGAAGGGMPMVGAGGVGAAAGPVVLVAAPPVVGGGGSAPAAAGMMAMAAAPPPHPLLHVAAPMSQPLGPVFAPVASGAHHRVPRQDRA